VDWPRRRVRSGWPAMLAAAGSVAATVAVIRYRPGYGEAAGNLGLVECALLLVTVVVAVRWAPPRQALLAAALGGLAVSVCVLRFLPTHNAFEVVGACAFWGLGPLVAIVVGGYPRLAEVRQERLVASARRDQRLSLARDLHDFVAHDVSGIVVQAQSARFVGGTDPDRQLDALARIEAAGLQALAVMDRTVHMLDAQAGSPPGLDELPAVLERFGDPLSVDVEPDLAVPREVGATAYRVVTEALTNVRRHATGASSVHVRVRLTGESALTVSVTDNGGVPSRRRTGGGTGLAALRERVRLLGGELDAGPDGNGWCVMATLPLAGR
jgi:signal transduction histidine kinase